MFTAIESGAVACVYAFCCTMVIYKEYKWRELRSGSSGHQDGRDGDDGDRLRRRLRAT